jgi:enamine deaminase RidA (YjgF/YER057c/UK114 family)
MELRAINPNHWLGAFHVNHALEVKSAERMLFVSGQTSNDAHGVALHPGDLPAQFLRAWANLVEVLFDAGMTPANIVRMTIYTTDVPGLMAQVGEIVPVWATAGCKPAATLVGVTRLFDPNIMVEIEATAVA